MDKEKALKIVFDYAEKIKRFFNVRKVVLFGSYAYGNPKEFSDIDVAVVVEKMGDDILSSEALLFSLGDNIDLRIEPLLFEEGKDNSGFLDYILKNGIVVYQAA